MSGYSDDGSASFRFRIADLKRIVLFLAVFLGLSILGSILGPPWSTIIFIGTLGFFGLSMLRMFLLYNKRNQMRKPEKTWKSYDGVPKKYPYNIRKVPPKRRPRKPTDDDWESTVDA